MLAIPFPAIDPTLVEIGPFAIRWYALAYIVSLLVGWRYVRSLAAKTPNHISVAQIDDLLVWITLGVILGGRLGYVFFYKPAFFIANPIEILQVWQGGMSFHGGLLGCIVAGYVFARRQGAPPLHIGDLCAAAGPIGLLLGRLANFVNGELWGRASDVPWAMIFPADPAQTPRHPSQLYEALLEGVLLFVILWLLARREAIRKRYGVIFGVFIAGYGLARFLVEFVREPDAHLGILFAGVSMGQLLSLPMIVVGVAIVLFACRRANG
jgi:phosphatidylglycerol:prolipoprotein diacylglycerol transferase